MFTDYGKGFSEENSARKYIYSFSKLTKIILPIVNWNDNERLKTIRIDPPDGTIFFLESIRVQDGYNLESLIKCEQIIIEIPRLKNPVTFQLIADMHLTHMDDSAPKEIQTFAYEREKCFMWFPEHGTEEIFENLLKHADKKILEGLILIGDILDFLSNKNVKTLKRLLIEQSRRYFYVKGNHESDRSRENIHAGMDLLSPLFTDIKGCSVLETAGVKLIGIDNTGYRVTAEKLEFLREQLADDKPCLLFMHVPLYLETLKESVLEMWKSPIMLGIPECSFIEQTPGIIHVPLPDKTTREFCRIVEEASNIFGIFAAHIHFSHTDRLPSGYYQYVLPPGYENACIELRLTPK